MDRRDFIKRTCVACAAGAFVPGLLSGCGTSQYVSGVLVKEGITVPVSSFENSKNERTRQYVIVHDDNLEFPIYLFRQSANNYNALWMKCTHQGSELQASGEYLHCRSHGSEFDHTGKVTQGPADENLRTFAAIVQGEEILIRLV